MKKIILVIVFVFSLQVFSQQKHQRKHDFETQPLEKSIYTQTLIFPVDSLSLIHFLFKISHQNIIFLKNGGDYNAGIRIAVEVTDTNSRFVTREIKDWKINASTFEQTTSSGIFAEGLISLKLSEGTYYLLPVLTDLNSNHEYKLKKQTLQIKPGGSIEPLIADEKKISCDDLEVFRLTNYEGNIPFSQSDKNIIIPVSDLSLNELNLKVVSNDDTVAEIKSDNFYESAIELAECSGKIVITEGDGVKTKNFILNDVTGRLKEGPFTLITGDDEEKKIMSRVFWYNKPKSLKFSELAVKALKHIDKESMVDSLLDIDDELQYEALVNYWKKLDPSPKTEYNELMAEYYSRVDYVQNNFSTITGTEGIDTDRGEIYIKFGKPDQVERASNEKGKVVETWIYKKSQRKFIFVDKQGVGEFSLESS